MRLLAFLAGVALVAAPAGAMEVKVRDGAGKTIAVVLDCNSCKDEKGKDCASGVVEGFHDGKPCGKCLLDANFNAKLLYSADIQIHGKLEDPSGKPVADEFVRLFLPNTWTVRTRSSKDGVFRLLLGATQERQGDSIQVRVGNRTRDVSSDATRDDYALYMLPENYQGCSDAK